MSQGLHKQLGVGCATSDLSTCTESGCLPACVLCGIQGALVVVVLLAT
jgi:hypothetical protein